MGGRPRTASLPRILLDTWATEVLNGLVVCAAMEGVPRTAGTGRERTRRLFPRAGLEHQRRAMRGRVRAFLGPTRRCTHLPGRLRRLVLLSLATLTVSLGLAGNAGAQLSPPWCGTPESDAAANLPDGSLPTHPAGSFPHIPYYAIGCTLADIEANQLGDRMTVEVIGHSALGRPMYGVVFNPLETPQQIRDYERWNQYRGIALTKIPRGRRRSCRSGATTSRCPCTSRAPSTGTSTKASTRTCRSSRIWRPLRTGPTRPTTPSSTTSFSSST